MAEDNFHADQADDPALIDSADEVASGFDVDPDPLDGDRQVERLDIEDVVGVDLGEPEATKKDLKAEESKHE